jgi:hypothetical protein
MKIQITRPEPITDLPAAEGSAPPAHITTLNGADVVRLHPHWHEARLRVLEVRLEKGDILLIDPFALRLLAEVHERLEREAFVAALVWPSAPRL